MYPYIQKHRNSGHVNVHLKDSIKSVVVFKHLPKTQTAKKTTTATKKKTANQ